MRNPLQLIKSLLFWLPILTELVAKIVRIFRKTFSYLFKKIGGYWGQISHFKQNLVIGLVIALLIHFAHGTTFVRETEDWAIDWMNLLQVNTSLLSSTSDTEAHAYTYISMDEESYESWGEPYHFPRDKLVQLIRYAINGGAKQIIVDVDLSRAGTDPEAAEEFKVFIEKYPQDAPPLILMRGFRVTEEGYTGLPMVRNAYFGNQLDSAKIHWAQPQFSIDLKDNKIRRWRLVEAVCDEGKPAWLPSPQFLSLTLSSKDSKWSRIEKILNDVLPEECHKMVAFEGKDRFEFHIDDNHIDLSAKGFHQRVIYSYSDRLRMGDVRLGYLRLPAHLITESGSDSSSEPVKDRIIVIGASYQDSRDIHQTPVGPMSGAQIVLNAIKSLKQYGQLNAIPPWTKILLEILMITIMAYTFANFGSLLGVILTGAFVIMLLMPLSFYFFHYGIWLDLAGPILGMQLHYAIADYEDAIKMRNRLRDLEAANKA